MGGAAIIPAAVSLTILHSISVADCAIQLGILAHAFPPSRARSIAFATFAAGAPVGGALGTILGGAFTQYTKYVTQFISLYCSMIAAPSHRVFWPRQLPWP